MKKGKLILMAMMLTMALSAMASDNNEEIASQRQK